MKRKTGYYWVIQQKSWIIGYWSNARGEWSFEGSLTYWTDEAIYKVDERRIVREI